MKTLLKTETSAFILKRVMKNHLVLIFAFISLTAAMNASDVVSGTGVVSGTAANTSDFSYSYNNVLESQADDYIVSKQNIQVMKETLVSYWCPIDTGTEALLTQKFTFSNPTTSIYLFTKLSSYNFGGGDYGSGSFWVSTDNTNWQLILDAPTPSGIDAGYSFDGYLSLSLLGTTVLYTQTRLETSGWNIMAQWSRDTAGITEPVFTLKVDVVPEPSSAILLLAGAVLCVSVVCKKYEAKA